jgi:hypothetical protein
MMTPLTIRASSTIPYRHGFFIALVLCMCVSPPKGRTTELNYDDGNRRDPFTPLSGLQGNVRRSPDADLHIGGIIYDPMGGSIAVLNGESYREGDQIGNVTLISIFKDRVILQQEDAEKTLWIREEVVDDNSRQKEKDNL